MEFDKKNQDLGQEYQNLYPTTEIQTNEKTEQKQNMNSTFLNNFNIMEFIKIFSLFKSKKLDINSILSSSLGKNLGGIENISEIVNLLKPTKVQTLSETEKLPKIDSLERIN